MSETCRVLYRNKVENCCIYLAPIIRIYRDAPSFEYQRSKHVGIYYDTDFIVNLLCILFMIVPCISYIKSFICPN